MLRKFIAVIIAFASLTVSIHAQRFDWVSFTPLSTGSDGSGTRSVANDSEGNIYTVCFFNDPIIAGQDTLYHTGNPGRPDILLAKWNPAGEVINYRHIANWSNNGNPDPQEVIFDELNDEILLTFMSYYNGMQITLLANDTETDSLMSLTPGAVLRFTTDLDFISYKSIPGATGYTTPTVLKDEYVYSAQGYNSLVSRTDTSGTEYWSVSSNGSYYVHDIAISPQDSLYVIGYSQYGGELSMGGISTTAPSLGNFTHAHIFKLDTAGTVQQGIHFLEAAYYLFPLRLTTDDDGNLYVAGSYQIGGQVIGDHTLSNPTGVRDGFVTKLNSSLEPIWTTEFHHTGGDMKCFDVVFHPDGHIVVVGNYSGTGTFGQFSFDGTTQGYCFLTKIDVETGDILHAESFGTYAGSATAYAVSRVDNKYYIGGMSGALGESTASYGCYTHSFPMAYLTLFTDTMFSLPSLSLQYGNGLLTASSNIPDPQYTWYLNGEVIEGETSGSITPAVIGTYEVMVSYFGCTTSAEVVITEIINSTDHSVNAVNLVQLFPNPSHGFVSIVNIPADSEIRLLDITGKMVFRELVRSSQLILNTAGFADGVYNVQIETNGTTTCHKLMVSH